MANRYWIGGTGTWNTSSTTNWSTSSGGASGASVPTASDSVFFDQAATYTVTLTGALTCLNLTVSAGTVTFTSTGTIAISGSLSLVTATVWNATGTITFNSTTTGNTITTNAVSISCAITFNGVGGTWQLQDALTSGATRTCTLTAGTLDLNNFTLTTGLFNSNNSNVRVLAFGTGKIVVTGSSFNVNTATNFSFTGTSNIEGTYSGAVGIRVFIIGDIAGGSQAVAMNLKITAGTDTVYVYRFWNDVDFTGFAGTFDNVGFRNLYGSLTLSTGMTLVAGTNSTTFAATSGTKTITSAGRTMDFPITFNGVGGAWAMQDALTLGATRALTFTNGTLQLKAGTTNTVGSFVTSGTTLKYLQSTTPGTQATISDASGTDSVTYLSIQDSNATGGAVWEAFTTNENVDAGNNSGWDFSFQLGRYIYTRRKNKRILS